MLNIKFKDIIDANKSNAREIYKLKNLMDLFGVTVRQVCERASVYDTVNLDIDDRINYFYKLARRNSRLDSIMLYINSFFEIVNERYLELEGKEACGIKENLLKLSPELNVEILINNSLYKNLQNKVFNIVLKYEKKKAETSLNESEYDEIEKILKMNGIKFNFGFDKYGITYFENEDSNLLYEAYKQEEIFINLENRFMELDVSKCYFLVHNWNDIKRILWDETTVELLTVLINEPIEYLNSAKDEIKYSMTPNNIIIDNAIEYSYILNIYRNLPLKIKASHSQLWIQFYKELKKTSVLILENLNKHFDSIVSISSPILEFLFVYLCTNCDYTISEDNELLIIMPH
ncbi:hypothetical protein EDD66_110127 [Mobilisporobacter senegalensis]|uniref:Uncharacterized protein n=1 Tax=Mobilisporobacter senegalensis TaxID=1329262 RepID=A0A3N1XGD1_9FIRM|nr:hypothetical protein [Mobilisporobacter senegalensis]ROR25770.1 hypothetical protein EDD66_110127 [Mobilisporobacter senegalensis]